MTAATAAKAPDISAFLGGAAQALGADNVRTAPDELDLMSCDFSEIRLATAGAVLRPGSAEEVSAIASLASRHGVPLVPRGGGMSYTLGAVPAVPGAAVVDMRRLNRIVEIDPVNRHVTVETGATWAQLGAALAPHGLASGFRGTMSGSRATIGGGLGNNATGHGLGDINDDLLGLQVVLPDGRIVETGARAAGFGLPGVRNQGPDLTSLFVHDAGVFGLKTKASFRLHEAPKAFAAMAFGFNEEAPLIDAICAAARTGQATDVMGFGAYHHRVFAGQPKPPPEEAKALMAAVMRGAGNPIRGAWRLLQLGRPGALAAFLKVPYSLLIACEGATQSIADAKLGVVRRALKGLPMKRMSPALAIALRANPFPPIEQLITGVDGECCFPSNCTVPLGRAQEVIRTIDAFFKAEADGMARHGIFATRIYLTLGPLFGCEPIIYWRDAMNPLRASILSPERRAALAKVPANLEARAAAIALRRRLIDAMDAHGASHFQIGKYYPYREAISGSGGWDLLQTLKTLIDPAGVMNPGALGLGEKHAG